VSVVSKRLGEVLIERGAISADGLEMALRNQLMLGGHLGTCLLELGLIDEETLGTALADTLRVPYAKSSDLLRAEELAIRSLTRSVVEEYRAVPFRRNGKSLDVAMIDPRDLPAIDALSFASQCKVVPWVAPEIRIFDAMERHYDIPRRMRYVVISRSLSPLGEAAKRDRRRSDAPAEPAVEQPLGNQAAVEFGAQYGYGRSWVEVAEELAARGVSPEPERADGANDLASQLCRANHKDEIARVVLEHALRTMKRAMLFVVKGDGIALWDSAGFERKPESAALGTIGLRGLTILDHLLGHDHYQGPLGDSAAHRELYTRLNVPAPIDVLLVPVHINDRLVALLVGDGGPEGRVEGDPREGLRLGRMLGLALNLVIFKKKIRSLGSFSEHSPR
jgi:hypothetical protein